MSAVLKNPPPRGERVDIGGGRMMHVICAGPAKNDSPTVVFESGAFGFSADWGVVQEQLAGQDIRSCAYDRAGLGFSDPGPSPRDSTAIVGDLDRLLIAIGETDPVLLVGHSMAGLHLRLFAASHPSRVAGVVLVDATTPESLEEPAVRLFVRHFTTLTKLAAWGAEVGLFKPLTGTGFADKIGLSSPANAEKRWAFASGKHNRWAAAEVAQWGADVVQAIAAGNYDPEIPVAVLLASGADRNDERWAKQIAPAMASRHGFVETVAGSEHATLLGLTYADHVVRAVLWIREAAKALAKAA